MNESTEQSESLPANWPRVFNVPAYIAFLAVAGVLAVSWLLVIAHDLLRIVGDVQYPMWGRLFADDRPIEWLQWFVLISCVVLSGYLAGKLTGNQARFFTLMGFSSALIFLEDASELRFMLYLEYTRHWFGPEIIGYSTSAVHDTVYFLLIASLPVYTAIRYARYVWHDDPTRRYLLGAFVFYGLAVLLSTLRHVYGFYDHLGERIDQWIFFSRWPDSPYVPEGETHVALVNLLIGETLETLGAASLIAMILAYAWYHRSASPAASTVPDTDATAGHQEAVGGASLSKEPE